MAETRREVVISARFDVKADQAKEPLESTSKRLADLEGRFRLLEDRFQTLSGLLTRNLSQAAQTAGRDLRRLGDEADRAGQKAANALRQTSGLTHLGLSGSGGGVTRGGSLGHLAGPGLTAPVLPAAPRVNPVGAHSPLHFNALARGGKREVVTYGGRSYDAHQSLIQAQFLALRTRANFTPNRFDAGGGRPPVDLFPGGFFNPIDAGVAPPATYRQAASMGLVSNELQYRNLVNAYWTRGYAGVAGPGFRHTELGMEGMAYGALGAHGAASPAAMRYANATANGQFLLGGTAFQRSRLAAAGRFFNRPIGGRLGAGLGRLNMMGGTRAIGLAGAGYAAYSGLSSPVEDMGGRLSSAGSVLGFATLGAGVGSTGAAALGAGAIMSPWLYGLYQDRQGEAIAGARLQSQLDNGGRAASTRFLREEAAFRVGESYKPIYEQMRINQLIRGGQASDEIGGLRLQQARLAPDQAARISALLSVASNTRGDLYAQQSIGLTPHRALEERRAATARAAGLSERLGSITGEIADAQLGQNASQQEALRYFRGVFSRLSPSQRRAIQSGQRSLSDYANEAEQSDIARAQKILGRDISAIDSRVERDAIDKQLQEEANRIAKENADTMVKNIDTQVELIQALRELTDKIEREGIDEARKEDALKAGDEAIDRVFGTQASSRLAGLRSRIT